MYLDKAFKACIFSLEFICGPELEPSQKYGSRKKSQEWCPSVIHLSLYKTLGEKSAVKIVRFQTQCLNHVLEIIHDLQLSCKNPDLRKTTINLETFCMILRYIEQPQCYLYKDVALETKRWSSPIKSPSPLKSHSKSVNACDFFWTLFKNKDKNQLWSTARCRFFLVSGHVQGCLVLSPTQARAFHVFPQLRRLERVHRCQHLALMSLSVRTQKPAG